MTENSELERQYRKNLMIISCVMLVYSVAGGHIGEEINLSGVAIKFKNSGLLEWLGLIVMYFLWWRHWLVSGTIRKEMNDLVMKEVRLSPLSVKKIMQEFIPEQDISLNKKSCTLRPSRRHEYLISVGPSHMLLGEIKFHTFFPMQLTLGHSVVNMINHLQGNYEYTKDTPYKVPSGLVRCSVTLDYLKYYLSCALKYPSFGDGILPSLIVAASTIAFIVNKI